MNQLQYWAIWWLASFRSGLIQLFLAIKTCAPTPVQLLSSLAFCQARARHGPIECPVLRICLVMNYPQSIPRRRFNHAKTELSQKHGL